MKLIEKRGESMVRTELPYIYVTFHSKHGCSEDEEYWHRNFEEAKQHADMFRNDPIAKELYEKITIHNYIDNNKELYSVVM